MDVQVGDKVADMVGMAGADQLADGVDRDRIGRSKGTSAPR